MICKSCGSRLKEDAKFCSKCGATVEGSVSAKTNSGATVTNATVSAQQRSRKNFKWVLATGVVVVVLWLIFGGRSAEKTAEQLMTSILEGNASKCVSLFADELIEAAAAETEKVLVHQMESELENVIDSYMSEYSDDWDFSVKVIDSYDSDLSEEIDEKVKEVIVSVEHEGSGFLWSAKEGEDTYCVTVIKDGRKWYVLDWYRT